MLIRKDPVFLFLSSTETESELFSLGQKVQIYYVHRIDVGHKRDISNKITVRSRPKGSDDEWENEIVFTWNASSQRWHDSTRDNTIYGNTLMEYQIVADETGTIVYITDTHNPHPRHDVIYLMADAIVSLENEQKTREKNFNELALKIKTLERAVFEGK